MRWIESYLTGWIFDESVHYLLVVPEGEGKCLRINCAILRFLAHVNYGYSKLNSKTRSAGFGQRVKNTIIAMLSAFPDVGSSSVR